MKIFENIRSSAFWTFDFLFGGKIKRNYNEIKFLFLNSQDPKAREIKNKYLDNLLRYATKTTPFYFNYKDYLTLNDFPVINKYIIRSDYSSFRPKVIPTGKKMYSVTTSGSTGTPFTVFHDKKKRLRHIADNIFFNELANSKLGSRLYYFRVWHKMVKKTKVLSLLQNLVTLDSGKLDTESIENNFLNKIKSDKSTKSVLAYASTLEAFARHLRKNYKFPIETKIKSIISQSETLSNEAKVDLEYYLSSKVVSRYSNMENGFIGQQCSSGNGEYHLNEASYFIEILDMNLDVPVESGEMGRIVVTDLFNYGMPLIRYDTGDIGTVKEIASCEIKNRVLAKIEGRRTDFIFDTKGNLLSPHVITNTMWKYVEILQFQFIQEAKKKYIMILNKGNVPFHEEADLIKDIKSFLGDDAEITIRYVEEIPLLQSGKRKKIINLLSINN
jgi:phenylacetate-CoA ligase